MDWWVIARTDVTKSMLSQGFDSFLQQLKTLIREIDSLLKNRDVEIGSRALDDHWNMLFDNKKTWWRTSTSNLTQRAIDRHSLGLSLNLLQVVTGERSVDL